MTGETFDQFVTALKQLANSCEFKERDTMILDRIVIGIIDTKMQEKLLQEPKLSLDQAISICRAMESSSVQQKEITREVKTNLVTVDAINNPRYRQQQFKQYQRSADQTGAKTKKCFCRYQSPVPESGIGKVSKTYKITLRDDSIPRIAATRKIPVSLKSKVKEKLDKMVEERIIVPVTEPTDWVHPIVIAPKSNGDIRVCMDPRLLSHQNRMEIYEYAWTPVH
ncbi:hypothetical protein QE152_g5742 [Popillia japonica]|uniref:Uncharacterized protein n=1 Tax=Popillia japonica TaxID=7064 RepID=A0AAW1MPF7_POPJA